MGEELPHALFVALVFEVHVSHKALRFSVAIRTLKEHSDVSQRANVVFADVNDEARVCFLLDGDLTTLLFGSDLDAWLRDLNLFLVQIGGDLNRGMAIRYRVDSIHNRVLHVIYQPIRVLIGHSAIDEDFLALNWRRKTTGRVVATPF